MPGRAQVRALGRVLTAIAIHRAGPAPDHPYRDEFADAGLTAATRYALEGAAWLFADLDGWLDGGKRTAVLLDALRSVEQEPSLFGVSSHMLTVAVVK